MVGGGDAAAIGTRKTGDPADAAFEMRSCASLRPTYFVRDSSKESLCPFEAAAFRLVFRLIPATAADRSGKTDPRGIP
jgi:hypothetical protein